MATGFSPSIRGSAVNQDGRSSGLTAPNAPSQEAVIRAALANAGVEPGAISYVEAHGTGTSLGDPIEARALGAALCQGRPMDRPLLVGSVKSNIGHLESAAGVAGVIKVVLALQHRRVPKHLHFRAPSPHIPWDELALRVVSEATEWTSDGPRLAGVSSFGFSGTNAHVVIEEAPEATVEPPAHDRSAHLLTISAKTDDALRDLVRAHAADLPARDTDFAAFCATTTAGRAHFSRRLAVAARSAGEAARQIDAWLAGGDSRVQSGGVPSAGAPDVAFLFTGQGAQYAGMGRELYESLPVFRETVDRCSSILEPMLGRSLTTMLYGAADLSATLDDTAYTQPAIFAIDYALAAVWQSWGVQPAVVAGHSLGEYAAACVAGVLPLEDALRLVVERGRLMQSLPREGAMVAIMAPESGVRRAIGGRAGVSIAAINAPDNVVITGRSGEVAEVVRSLEASGVECRRLAISNGFHSPLVDPILDSFERAASDVRWRAPQIALVSNLTGQIAGPEIATAAYWRRHLREPVRFAETVATLWNQGVRVFLETGPHSTLLGVARRCVPEGAAVWAPSLRRDQPPWWQILNSAATVYAAGVSFDWQAFEQPYRRPRVDVPTYRFHRERCWITVDRAARSMRAGASAPSAHPLGAARLRCAVPTFEYRFDTQRLPMLGGHRVNGVATMPAAGFAEIGLSACREVLGRAPDAVDALVFREPLVVPDDGLGRLVQCVVRQDDGEATFEVSSAADESGTRWTLHATGRVRQAIGASAAPVSIDGLRGRFTDWRPASEYHDRLRERGVDPGADLLCAEEIGSSEDAAFARMRFADDQVRDASRFWLHPTLLDACTLLVGAVSPDLKTRRSTVSDRRSVGSGGMILAGVGEIRKCGEFGQTAWVHVMVRDRADDGSRMSIDVSVYDAAGRPVVLVSGMDLVHTTRLPGAVRAETYELAWEDAPVARAMAGDLAAIRDRLASSLDAALRRSAGPNSSAADYHDLLLRLDGAITGWIRRALTEIESTSARVAGRQQRLFSHLTATTGAGAGSDDPDRLARELSDRYPSFARHVALATRGGQNLTAVLTGARDPLDVLFPDGSFDAVEALYRDSPVARAYNETVADAVVDLVRSSGKSRVRILEIGAGTGSTTAAVLPRLDPARASYTFTDLSPLFLSRARERFAGLPFVEYALFDAERDPAAQGLPTGAYDVVIAANVLHATADLARTLANVRNALAPGGALVLLEGHGRQGWVDITFGLTEGWWRFSDAAVRPDYPLIDPERWAGLLETSGFDDVEVIGPRDDRESTQQSVILARATAAPHPNDRASRLVVVGTSELAMSVAGLERGCIVAQTPEALRSACRRAVEAGPFRVVCFWPPSSSDRPDAGAVERATAHAVQCLQALIAAGPAGSARLWFVTENAQPVRGGDPASGASPFSLDGAAVVGLGRGISVEHPDVWGGLVDVDAAEPVDVRARAVLDELDRPDDEDQVAHRGTQRLAPRIAVMKPPSSGTWQIRPDMAYLCTGGLGGVAVSVAEWLVARGARHLVLTTRRALPPRSAWPDLTRESAVEHDETRRRVAAVERLEAAGAAVDVAAVDVADEAGMTALFARFGADLPPLAGVFHCAADISSMPVGALDVAALHAMLRPKVAGAIVIDRLTRGIDLDFIVLFSSTTALWGVAGLAHYAAANTCLDALAHARRAEGRPFVSINWGTWDVMRLASDADRRSFAEAGMRPMDSASALEALARLGVHGPAQAAVASVDWAVLKPLYEARRPRPLFARMGAAAGPTATSPAAARVEPAALRERLDRAAPEDHLDVLRVFVSGEVARILGADDPDALDRHKGLFEMGMDSLMSVELKSRLERAAGVPLPSTLTFNYPNIEALTNFLEKEIAPSMSETAPGPVVPPASAAASVSSGPADALEGGIDLDELSEDALAELLAARLEEIR